VGKIESLIGKDSELGTTVKRLIESLSD